MRIPALITLLIASMATGCSAHPSTTTIRLNTVGFLPDSPKVATITSDADSFVVIDETTGNTILESSLSEARKDADTSETVRIADFSSVQAPGRYRITIPGTEASTSFTVSPAAFSDAFRTVVRGMYLWRCGTAVSGEHQGDVFEQKACHLEDGWLDHATGEHVHHDGTGGWHDAGDHNKYIVNAAVTVGAMLRAWEDFGPAVRAIPLGIPESGGPIPDLLAEIKWETDWMLKMQAADGSVYHKLSTLNFGGMIMPDVETTPRYYTGWSSAATAGFVATLASTARSIRPYDTAYADRLVAAATKSFTFLLGHPEEKPPEQSKFSTGGYTTSDPDDRLWAAAELWETTGDAAVLRDLESRIRAMGTAFDEDFGWGKVKNLGLITYLVSQREGRDPALVEAVRADLISMANHIVSTSQRGGYGRPLGSIYYWGCHGGVAMQTMLLQTAHRLTREAPYRHTALQAVDHLLGRNYFGRSMVTGVGGNPPLHPHCRRSAGDKIAAPWPGYLIGGPQKGATDWEDRVELYAVNEIAINWNGALIYALAGFLPTP